MRAVIQRVKEASVTIGGQRHAEVGQGMMILLGITHDDTEDDITWLVKKICALRIFADAEGVMNLGIHEVNGEILVVSQFTLYASTKKGNRPSYILAARPEVAVPLYEKFLQTLNEEAKVVVRSGVFGADMKVGLVNDGPVTIIIDTKVRE